MRRLFPIALVLLFCLGWSFSGCGSSSTDSNGGGIFDPGDGGGGGGLTLGDTSDAEFQAIEGAIGSVDDLSEEMFGHLDIMLDTLRQNPNWIGSTQALTPAADTMEFDSFHVAYHTDTQFWYFYWIASDTVYGYDTSGAQTMDIWTTTIEDSIRFRQDYAYRQWPDTTSVNQISLGVNMSVSSTSGMVDLQVDEFITIDGDIFGTGEVTLTGAGDYDIGMNFFGCDISVDMAVTLSSLTMDINATDQACPSAGSLSMSGTSGVVCTGPDGTVSESDSYSITQTFESGNVHVIAEDATTRWELTQSCSELGDPGAAPLPMRLAERFIER